MPPAPPSMKTLLPVALMTPPLTLMPMGFAAEPRPVMPMEPPAALSNWPPLLMVTGPSELSPRVLAPTSRVWEMVMPPLLDVANCQGGGERRQTAGRGDGAGGILGVGAVDATNGDVGEAGNRGPVGVGEDQAAGAGGATHHDGASDGAGLEKEVAGRAGGSDGVGDPEVDNVPGQGDAAPAGRRLEGTADNVVRIEGNTAGPRH